MTNSNENGGEHGAGGDFEAAANEILPHIDEALAANGVELPERPFAATLQFVADFVLEIRDGQGRQFQPTLAPEEAEQEWFRSLFGFVEDWYRRRYGSALERQESDGLRGFVLIWGTAFELAVPSRRIDPDIPGETIWVRFPASVLSDEDPLTWIVSPPNLEMMTALDREALKAKTAEQAHLLRSIKVSLMGIPAQPNATGEPGLLASLVEYLVAAARRPIGAARAMRRLGLWDLQMACECALKALLQHRTGSFPRTHDLLELFDALGEVANIERGTLEQFPSSADAIDNRYGGGREVSLARYSELFLLTLQVVAGALQPMVQLGIGNAQFKLARPPWRRDV